MTTRASELLDVFRILEVSADPVPNPAKPAEGRRHTYLITFDYGDGDTKGMLNALRSEGFWVVDDPSFPRTTIICRTASSVKGGAVRKAVSDALEDNGSAAVVKLNGNQIWVWPKTSEAGANRKEWKAYGA